MTDQIRRASRSVCSNLAESWRKRRYRAVFINKLTDAQQEASETQTWLDFCLACKYINYQKFERLDQEYENILAMLNSMEMKAHKFCFNRQYKHYKVWKIGAEIYNSKVFEYRL